MEDVFTLDLPSAPFMSFICFLCCFPLLTNKNKSNARMKEPALHPLQPGVLLDAVNSLVYPSLLPLPLISIAHAIVAVMPCYLNETLR